MHLIREVLLPAVCLLLVTAATAGAQPADPAAGAANFRACAACHSLEPGRQMTGPSLAGIWGREAATVDGFGRYSQALRSAGLTWTAETLDAWLHDPAAFVPGNRMTYRGLKDAKSRRDLIAFLRTVDEDGNTAYAAAHRLARAPDMPDLKALPPGRRIERVRYCGDTYHITTAAGQTIPVWEFNVRFKTDSSERGPAKGRPALLPASMMGDRMFVVFAAPAEISTFITNDC